MPLLSQVPITTIIDYLGVMIGVIAGTLYAIDRKMDTLGAAALGIVTGFGGGIIRDLLLQDQGIFFMEHPLVILAGICLSVVLSLLRRYLPDFYKHLFYIDAFLMAWYVLAGAAKTWFAGLASSTESRAFSAVLPISCRLSSAWGRTSHRFYAWRLASA